MSATALPDQLSDASREFAGREHQLLIDGERAPAADGRTFQTLDPATAHPDRRRRARAAPRTSTAPSPPRGARSRTARGRRPRRPTARG